MSSPDLISQLPAHTSMQIGQMSAFGEGVLAWLNAQRRVFNHLDWWTPFEWLYSDAFTVVSSAHQVQAAMLAVPVSFRDINHLDSAQAQVAWLRWCAVADGVSASSVLRPLFAHVEAQLRAAGVEQSFCLIDPLCWMLAYLREAGYTRVDDVVTMAFHTPAGLPGLPGLSPEVSIRTALTADLDQVRAVDERAFEQQWHFPNFVLQRALNTSTYFSVAEAHGRVIGYQFAVCSGDEAHITRLAVYPEWQGRSVGAHLLADVIEHLWRDCSATLVTLNTQTSNEASQRLYHRFGFQTVHPGMRVMRKQHH